jgi:hypothetical protein
LSEVSSTVGTKTNESNLDNVVEKFFSSAVNYAHKHPVRGDDGAKLIRALLVELFSNEELVEIQDKNDVPKEDQVRYGRQARKQGRLDYNQLTGWDNVDDLVLSKEATQQLV